MHSRRHIPQAGPHLRSARLRGLLLAALMLVPGLVAAGCGGIASSSTTITHHTSAPRVTTAHVSAPAPASGTSALSGKWSGQYSGAYNGTFSLNWTQAGSKLSGHITLSSPSETTGITGSVSGESIKFGTVSGAIYNGTVSGSSMSGSYQTPTGGGSWSASKA